MFVLSSGFLVRYQCSPLVNPINTDTQTLSGTPCAWTLQSCLLTMLAERLRAFPAGRERIYAPIALRSLMLLNLPPSRYPICKMDAGEVYLPLDQGASLFYPLLAPNRL